MRTILACLVLLSLALNSIAQDLDCGINVNGVVVPSANKCITTGAPACVNVGEGDELVYRCRQCYSNCDCGIGTYCIKSAGTDKGTCRDVEDSILSRTCNRFNTESDKARDYPGTLKFPLKGIDDETVCGIPMFDNDSGNFTGYEWFGYCDAGECSVCANLGETYDQEIAFSIRSGDPGSLLCPGRACYAGKLIKATFASNSIYDKLDVGTSVSAAILVFVILLAILSLVSTAVVVKINNANSFKRVGDRI
eukprot:TRINITY_DN6821_c0_g1_i1.p1 TRINITY_DN6821_c0_g1~~TRINITY_DN6821_c0_g1_i1.p1  ORF type:complete len:251 (-),score=53.59 TRINITY_DN6821_c0_g1_i1:150-902(-)